MRTSSGFEKKFCSTNEKKQSKSDIETYFRNNLIIIGSIFLALILLLIYFFIIKFTKFKIVLIIVLFFCMYILPIFIVSIIDYIKTKNTNCDNYIKFNFNACKKLEGKNLDEEKRTIIILFSTIISISCIMLILLPRLNLNIKIRQYRGIRFYKELLKNNIKNPKTNTFFYKISPLFLWLIFGLNLGLYISYNDYQIKCSKNLNKQDNS